MRWSFSVAILFLLLLHVFSAVRASELMAADSQSENEKASIPLVIMPFQNETNDVSWDWLSYGLMERVPFEFLRAFDSQTNPNWISAAKMKGVETNQLLERVRDHASTGYIWWGAYTVHDGLWTVSVRLVEIESGESVALGDQGEITGTLEEISRGLPLFALQILKDKLKAPIDKAEELKFSEVRAVSLEAWESFSKAYGYLTNVQEDLTEQRAKNEWGSGAAALLERATREDAEYDHAWAFRGWLYLEKGEIVEARRDFQKALGVTPDSINALAGLGVSYFHDEDMSHGVDWFSRILQMNPSLSLYRFYLFLGLLSSNQVSRALAVAGDLSQSGFDDMRKMAMHFASRTSDPQVIPLLLRGLKDPVKEVRIEAINGLVLFHDPRVMEALVALIQEQDIEIRLAAIDALSEVEDPRTLPLLEASMKDPDQEIRIAVINAFERAFSSVAVPVLLSALKDEDQHVREAAFRVLADKRDSRVRPVVMSALMDDDPVIRAIAAQALAEDGDPDVRGQLAVATRDSDPDVRKAAVQSLMTSANEVELPLFLEAMADSDPGVRESAIRGVQELTSDSQDRIQLVPVLVQTLKDDTPEVRIAVLESLAVFGDAQSHQAIRNAYGDPDEQVRAGAIWALSATEDPSDFSLIQSALEDPVSEVRSAAAQVMASSNNPRVIHSLLNSTAISDNELRKTIFRTLSDISTPSDNPEVVRYLVAALNDPDGEIRSDALLGLQRMKSSQIDSAIRNALKDPDEQVQRTAMGLYLQSEECCDTAFLLKTLESRHDDGELNWAVIEVLGRSKEPEAIPRLLLLLGDENESVRRATLQALSSKEDRRIVPALLRLLAEDPDSSIRAEAAAELANRDETGVASALTQSVLYERNKNVRFAAAQALGQAGNRSAVPVLLGLLQDEDVYMRTTAIEALANIGDDRAVPELIKIVESGDDRLRVAAATALGEMKSRGATAALSTLLKDNNLSLREAVVSALGGIGDAQAVDGLLDALRDENQSVCIAAIQALAGIEDSRKIPALRESAQNLNKLVAAAAKEALEPSNPSDLQESQ